jgi:hypothetical protein
MRRPSRHASAWPRVKREKGEGVQYGGGCHTKEGKRGGADTACSQAAVAGRWQDAGAAEAVPGQCGTGEGVRR